MSYFINIQQTLADQIEHIENALHAVVGAGDDDALFIASYLHGHFDIVVTQVDNESHPSLSTLDQCMQNDLADAFANNELESADQVKVYALWQQLVDGASRLTA